MLCLQSWTKADDIRDFEIEGMSIGDSLLDFFSKSEINTKKGYYKQEGENRVFARLNLENIKNYDKANVLFKNDDPKFRVAVATGYIWYKDDLASCLKKKSEIIEDVKSIFSNLKIDNEGKREHFIAKNSYTYSTYFLFPGEYPQSHIVIACYDWSEDLEYWDHLRVGIVTSEYMKYLNTLEK